MESYARYAGPAGPAWARAGAGGLWEPLDGAPWGGGRPAGGAVASLPGTPLPPAEPRCVVCVGLNYRDHAREMGLPAPSEPLIFLKPVGSLLAPGAAIRVPAAAGRVDHEAELALVVGRAVGPDTPPDGFRDAVFGYTCANDVTARDLQARDGQWTRAKGFDTFCPLGPVLVRGLDPADLAVECRVNGALRQSSRTRELIFPPERLLRFAAGVMSLLPGDVLLTGTPAGVGPLAPGDRVEVRIEGVGTLSNPVA